MSKFKAPRSFQAAVALLATLPSKALVLGPSAKRKYATHHGPWDADHFDAVAHSLEALIASGALNSGETRQVLWSLSSQYWMVGLRDIAERMTTSLCADPACEPGMRRAADLQLSQIRAGLTPFGTRALPQAAHVAEAAAEATAVLAPMLEAKWVPYFTSTIEGLAAALDRGDDLPADAVDPISLAIHSSAQYPPIATADIGRSARYLFLSASANNVLGPHLPDDAIRRSLRIEGHGDYVLIDLPAHDCLVESQSHVLRNRHGRLRISRGLFDPARISGRKFFRPLGSHEIFVAPGFVRELKRLIKEAGFKGVSLPEDITKR